MEYNLNGLKIDTEHIYLFHGNGKWKDIDGQIYNITSIRYPTTTNGKHIHINSDIDVTASYRSVCEGEILSFEINRVEKEDC